MDEHADDSGRTRYEALKDRYPDTPETRERLAQDEVQELSQVVRELSDAMTALVAYLIEIAPQAEGGQPGPEPERQARLRSLQADIHALRQRLPDV